MLVTKDFENDNEALIYEQYKNDETYKTLLRLMGRSFNELSEQINLVDLSLDIDNAVGVQLNIIGSIVGQPREIIDVNLFTYFGFGPDDGGFGDEDDPSVGARFADENEVSNTGTRLLVDDEYKLYIKARIASNYTSASVVETKQQLRFITGADEITVYEDGGPAFARILIGKPIDNQIEVILRDTDIIPVPLGVKVVFEGFYEAGNVFGFGDEDNPENAVGNLGFGDEDNPNVGGKFATGIEL